MKAEATILLDLGNGVARLLRFCDGIERERFSKHLNERPIARQKHRVLILVTALPGGSEIQTGERFARAGYPGDETDDLLTDGLGRLDRGGDILNRTGKVFRPGFGPGYLFYVVATIKRLSCLNNRRGWAIAPGQPSLGIDRLSGPANAQRSQQWPEPIGVHLQGLRKIVVPPAQRVIATSCGPSRDEDRNDRARMARLVKMLQIEAVTEHLIHARSVKLLGADLILHHENQTRVNHD